MRIHDTGYDITEMKAVAQALRESELSYRMLFDYTPVGLMQADGSGVLAFIDEVLAAGVEDLSAYVDLHPEVMSDGLSRIKFIDVNNAALDLYGATTKEEFYRYYLQHICLMDHEQIKRRFLKVARRQAHDEDEGRVVTRSDKTVYLNSRWVVVPGCEESYERILFSFVDITARKEAEERLRESEQRYRDVFESAAEGIFQSTPSGDFLSVNPAYARMLGYDSPEEFLANVKNVGQLVGIDSLSSGYLAPLQRSDVVAGLEQQFTKKDGKVIWVRVNVRAVRGADGTVMYHEGMTENITERKEAEEERQRLQSQLRQSQKMEAIGTLAGGVAHDFNNILTVLTGYGTLLQMRVNKDDPNRMYVDHILSASQKASNLIHSLLAFSRRQPISLAPVNIDGTVKGTEKLLRRLLTEDITLKTVTESDGQTVMADVTQIDQILFNLVTNARDAMPKGGTLIIETKLVDLDKDFRRMHGFGHPGRYVLLCVSDTGTGMDERTREQIFVPFFTTKEVGKGTGLGLSTVYGIVKQHHGYVTLYSEQGMGTTFHIYLPVAESDQVETGVSSGSIKKGTEKILVAEDNPAVRHLVCEILNEWGYSVIAAENGEEAIEKFLTNRDVHLLLFDSVMPKKNGREAYDAIHRIDPTVKVIFTSGYTRDIVFDKGIEEKRFDFISKPLQRDKLLERVREVLDRQIGGSRGAKG
jgi:PAS domain S-box-containing protein